jgi:hypothetical protein
MYTDWRVWKRSVPCGDQRWIFRMIRMIHRWVMMRASFAITIMMQPVIDWFTMMERSNPAGSAMKQNASRTNPVCGKLTTAVAPSAIGSG